MTDLYLLAVVKLRSEKDIHNKFCLVDMLVHATILARAISFLLVFLQKFEICSSKVSLQSKLIPRSFPLSLLPIQEFSVSEFSVFLFGFLCTTDQKMTFVGITSETIVNKPLG